MTEEETSILAQMREATEAMELSVQQLRTDKSLAAAQRVSAAVRLFEAATQRLHAYSLALAERRAVDGATS